MDRAGRFRRSPHISRTRSKKATARSTKRPLRRACRSGSKNGFAIWSAAWERSGALCRTRKHATANWNNATRNCWRLRPLSRSAPVPIKVGRIVGRLDYYCDARFVMSSAVETSLAARLLKVRDSSTTLGMTREGYRQTNVLCYGDFAAQVRRRHFSKFGRARLCRASEMRYDYEPEAAAPQSVPPSKKAVSHRHRLNVGRLQQTFLAQ